MKKVPTYIATVVIVQEAGSPDEARSFLRMGLSGALEPDSYEVVSVVGPVPQKPSYCFAAEDAYLAVPRGPCSALF